MDSSMTLLSANIQFLVRRPPSVVRLYALDKIPYLCLSEPGGGSVCTAPVGLLL